jgi:type II secretory pathway pseudopilin PulG
MRLTGKRLLLAVIVLVAAVTAFFLFGRADNSLRLQVQVSGTANAAQDGYRASGTGLADSPFGSVSLSGGGSGQVEANCVVYDGSGELTTTAGTLQLRLAKPGRACLTQATPDQVAGVGELKVTATVEATGTTGSLLGRHGRLKARGTYNPETDRFTVLFSGRLRH